MENILRILLLIFFLAEILISVSESKDSNSDNEAYLSRENSFVKCPPRTAYELTQMCSYPNSEEPFFHNVDTLNLFLETVQLSYLRNLCKGGYSNDRKTYFILNGANCYYPTGKASYDTNMVYPRVYNKIGNRALLFRIVPGSRITAYEYYTSNGNYNNTVGYPGNLNLNFKSPLLEDWYFIRPTIMNVTIWGEDGVVAWLTFNVLKNDTIKSWFGLNNLKDSYPWKYCLLKSASYNYFSIAGFLIRRFYISQYFGGCDNDKAALVVLDSPEGCNYLPGLDKITIPQILYNVINGDAGNMMESKFAKSLEIYAYYDDNIIIMG